MLRCNASTRVVAAVVLVASSIAAVTTRSDATSDGPMSEDARSDQGVIDLSRGQTGEDATADGLRRWTVTADWPAAAAALAGQNGSRLDGETVLDVDATASPPVRLILPDRQSPDEFVPVDVRLESIPLFSEEGEFVRAVFTLSWIGESKEGADLSLVFIDSEKAGWALRSGHVTPVAGRSLSFAASSDPDTVVLTEEPPVDLGDDVDPATLVPSATDGEAGPAGYRINPGTRRFDLLGVGLIDPGSTGAARLTADDAIVAAQAGATRFNTVMNTSSSTDAVTNGLTARLVGFVMLQDTKESTGQQELRNMVDSTPVLLTLATTLGADLTAGVRLTGWSNPGGCGYSSGRTGHANNGFVWSRACGQQTFAHELSHNLNADHGFAMYHHAAPQRRTLMADTTTFVRLDILSNDDLFFPGTTVRLGDATHDNAEIVTRNAAAVEAYRAVPVAGPGTFRVLGSPVRVVDTRTGLGGHGTAFGAGTVREFPMTVAQMGQGTTSVVATVTVIAGSTPGYVQAANIRNYPSDLPPIANFTPGKVRAQTAIISLTTYKTAFFRSSTSNVHLIVDIVGYFGNGTARYVPRTDPVRLLNTAGAAAGSHTPIDAAASCPVTNPSAAIVNLTSYGSTAAGHLQAKSAVSQATNAWSTVNYFSGETIANMAVVRLELGQFSIYTSAQSGIVVDLLGCFSTGAGGLRYVPLSLPVRALSSTTLGNGGIRDVTVSSLSSPAALVRVTGVNGANATYLTAYTTGRPNPGTSTVNFAVSAVEGNSAVVATNSSNMMRVARGPHPGSTNVIVDVFGRFVP